MRSSLPLTYPFPTPWGTVRSFLPTFSTSNDQSVPSISTSALPIQSSLPLSLHLHLMRDMHLCKQQDACSLVDHLLWELICSWSSTTRSWKLRSSDFQTKNYFLHGSTCQMPLLSLATSLAPCDMGSVHHLYYIGSDACIMLGCMWRTTILNEEFGMHSSEWHLNISTSQTIYECN